MRYEFRRGARISGVTPDVVSRELNRIAAAEGHLDPAQIVNEARPRNALLHPAFEWNNVVAGEAYRVGQARNMVRAVYVISEEDDDEPRVLTPEFVHVEGNGYQPTRLVVQRPDLYSLAMVELQRKFESAEQALRELRQAAEQDGSQPPDRLAAIALATEGFSTVREAIRALRR